MEMPNEDTLRIDVLTGGLVQVHKMHGDVKVLSMMITLGPDGTCVEFYGRHELRVTDLGVGPAVIVKDPK